MYERFPYQSSLLRQVIFKKEKVPKNHHQDGYCMYAYLTMSFYFYAIFDAQINSGSSCLYERAFTLSFLN